jgi:hypothetical protein
LGVNGPALALDHGLENAGHGQHQNGENADRDRYFQEGKAWLYFSVFYTHFFRKILNPPVQGWSASGVKSYTDYNSQNPKSKTYNYIKQLNEFLGVWDFGY